MVPNTPSVILDTIVCSTRLQMLGTGGCVHNLPASGQAVWSTIAAEWLFNKRMDDFLDALGKSLPWVSSSFFFSKHVTNTCTQEHLEQSVNKLHRHGVWPTGLEFITSTPMLGSSCLSGREEWCFTAGRGEENYSYDINMAAFIEKN